MGTSILDTQIIAQFSCAICVAEIRDNIKEISLNIKGTLRESLKQSYVSYSLLLWSQHAGTGDAA